MLLVYIATIIGRHVCISCSLEFCLCQLELCLCQLELGLRFEGYSSMRHKMLTSYNGQGMLDACFTAWASQMIN